MTERHSVQISPTPERYALNNRDAYPALPCPRCGSRPYIEWVDDTQLGDSVPWDLPIGRRWCETPGCVDETGSNAVPFGRLDD